jgi:hypothetical protein
MKGGRREGGMERESEISEVAKIRRERERERERKEYR